MTSRVIWDEGRTPGRELVTLGVAGTLTLITLDLLARGHAGWVLDLGFVPLCLLLALAVRPGDFFAIGIAPPLLLLAAFVLLALTRPDAIAQPDDGVVQAVVTGLALHSLPLGLGYAGCLGVLALRQHRLVTR
ncbi:hypothetical protein K8Z61_17035 [Nocardioides sp. TRM66260-LWL]|uniref:DUF6542 domain-containing protein n=1 Tax=Nocardioides sp. TRM66260-LWL TaxID=2874478 RepID=UPI001CC6B85F|nr:DUF6542 domain-containing protein [Nocardioides sp. TRM66260-LWL]MBZ5736200.1 hypothetical protein [Nocardioides sp. TRM66260-LWL]